MIDAIHIRKVESSDLPSLARIYAEVYRHFDVGEKWTDETALQLLSYWLKRNKDLCFVACEEAKVIGAFFADVKPWWDGNHLVDGEVFVAVDYQKKKVGTKLSIHLYEEAIKQDNVVSFDTYTFRLNGHPLDWYKSQGFKEVNEWVMISGNVKEALKKLKK
jgi:ribosomal protein S18 acetylase RimI-like enzyme